MPTATPDEPSHITARNVDLSNCDKEQIQFCGAIQPHGLLIAVQEPDLIVRHISANAEAMLGLSPDELLGRPLDRLFDADQLRQFRQEVARQRNLTCPPVHIMTARFGGRLGDAHVFVHRHDGLLIVEFESQGQDGSMSLQDLYSEVRTSIAELQATDSVQAFFDLAVSRIRRFTGYDRVLAYKFLEDGSGWVLAEDRDPPLESYVGLHYPASDVPEPARRLFSMKWISHLPDVGYEPVPLLRMKRANEPPLDLSYAFLRSVSVMYTGYLKNMGVQSTMVLTLLRQGKLWGLISCMHHRSPKHVPYQVRMAAEFLAHLMSLAMTSKEELEERDAVNRMKSLQSTLMEYMLRHVNFQEGLLRYDVNLLSYFGATGAVVLVDGHVHKLGDTPEDGALQDLFSWLTETMGQDQFATDCLSSVYPPGAAFQGKAAGMLVLRLFIHKPHFIVWFRPEVEHTVQWAGDPRKPVDVSRVNGEDRLLPRSSFALWKESVQGCSRPWKDSELAAAVDLRRAIVDVVLRKAGELARANEELTRSNEELDAFAYIASHDLKEPLRGIHNYARFVLDDYGEKLDAEGKAKLYTMLSLTHRMDTLLDSLLYYSRIGQQKLETQPTDLLPLVKRVVESLAPRLNELRATVRLPDALPVVWANPVMLEEVIANLITNALKYNDKPDKWVEIGTMTDAGRSAQAAEALAKGCAIVYVKDNGIGIPENRFDQIFLIFRRLHARDAYGGGTGVGLTIAKKIVERHGGQIWAESEPGVGSVFLLAFPSSDT